MPTGALPVAPFASPTEHLAALFHVITARIAAALEERWALGLCGAPAATSAPLIERARAELLLARAGQPTSTELAVRRGEIVRRGAVFDARLAATRARGLAQPLADAFDTWALEDADRIILVALLGAELSPVIARLFAHLAGHADAALASPTVETVGAVLRAGDGGVIAVAARLAADAPLRRLQLVAFGAAEDGPLLARPLVLAPRLAALARGEVTALDEALTAAGATIHYELAPSFAVRAASAAFHRQLRGALARGSAAPICWVRAPRGAGAAQIACDVALSLTRPALQLPAAAVRADAAWLGLITREARLHRAVVVVERGADETCGPLLRGLADAQIPTVLCDESGRGRPPTTAPLLALVLDAATTAERAQLWVSALRDGERTPHLGALTGLFPVAVGAATIEQVVAHARALATAAGRHLTADDLREGLYLHVAPALAGFRRPLPATRGWDALILAPDIIDQVRAIVGDARERRTIAEAGGEASGRAVGLLRGASGTGKSLIAGLLARDLELDLVELDLATIDAGAPIIDTALDAAAAGLALLAFDHAERASPALLRRLERLAGVVVLMTRVDADEPAAALRGAAATCVTLPAPTQEQRERMWQRAFAVGARLAAPIPAGALAREFKLTGGQIVAIAHRVTEVARATDDVIRIESIRATARRVC